MKFLKIQLSPIQIKGDPEDLETLQQDLYERVQAMIESETLEFEVLEDDEDEDSD